MKYSTSKEKLSLMHEQLDRELEMAGMSQPPKRKSLREQYRFKPELDENKKSTLSNISNKPVVYDFQVKEADIKSKKSQISDLERKLMELERKMDNISVSSGEDEERPYVKEIKQKLEFKSKIETNPNEDTARFLLGHHEQKQRNHTKFTYEYPSLPDESAEEEDSEDYFEIQQAIQKRKAQEKQARIKERQSVKIKRQSKEKAEVIVRAKQTDRKVSLETESHLRPKYSREKSNRSMKSNDKKSLNKKDKQSVISRKSVQKNKPLSRGKRSDSLTRSRPRNASRDSLNRSFDRSQAGEEITRGEEVQVAKDLKRVNNLEKELAHYKRLAKKYKQEVDDYKIMEIEFRELKKNFAKSETIRTQQKKIIESLKSKINR